MPELIFLDIYMPRMNGFDVLDELEKLDVFKNKIEVFMLSFSTSNRNIDLALSKKLCKGYINKPLDNDKLEKMMKWYLKTDNILENKKCSRPKYVLL